ncbi:MAG: App1 family protein [Nostocoides sp.]
MARPHRAAIVEDALNRRVGARLVDRGWTPRVVPFAGYGTVGFIRVMGRALLSRISGQASQEQESLRPVEYVQRGWRAFMSAPATHHPITVRVGDQVIETTSDRAGLVDLTVRGHGLAPGWHEVSISPDNGPTVAAPVLVVGASQSFGIVCDIDDTVLSTSLPRPFVAGWNTFVKTEATRRSVPGMAPLLRQLVQAHPGAPLIYVSTGAWNTAPLLGRFFRRNGFPVGPMLLTDWGPTSTGWFRSGRDHKMSCLHRLARELPHISWVLIGDDGQHDPSIYAEFASQRPDVVRLIALRELSTTEQVLSHVIPVSTDGHPGPGIMQDIPVVRGPDGYALRPLIAQALQASLAGTPAQRVEAQLHREIDGELELDLPGASFQERFDA